MRALTQDLVRRLDLQAGLEVEAAAVRDLMPEEPAWDILFNNAQSVSDWLASQLRAGYLPAPQTVVGARKAGHGVRPIAVLQPLDRVVYRSLTSLILAGKPTLDRSREKYLDFVIAPIKHGLPDTPEGYKALFGSEIQYIVKSDVTAFYQYIDHEILANELILQTGEFDAIEALIDFLADVQGRKFGLPQQLQASHELSEYYIDMVERRMIREGYAVWRYNDDFRIAAKNYSDALRAIDALSAAARELGLVIGEHKTSTPSFTTYLFDNTGLGIDDEIPSDISAEDAVGDYLDVLDEDSLEEARKLIQEATPVANAIVQGDLKLDDIRKLRRTIAAFRLEEDAGLTSEVARIVAYVASLTPDVARYLTSIPDKAAAAEAIDSIIQTVSLNEWQSLWIVDTIRHLELLSAESAGKVDLRYRWVRALAAFDRSPTVRAYSFWALAAADGVTVPEIELAMREAPSCLSSWYLSALAELARGASDKARKIINAVKSESKLNAWILA